MIDISTPSGQDLICEIIKEIKLKPREADFPMRCHQNNYRLIVAYGVTPHDILEQCFSTAEILLKSDFGDLFGITEDECQSLMGEAIHLFIKENLQVRYLFSDGAILLANSNLYICIHKI